MADENLPLVSVLAGVTVAVAAIIPLLWMATAPSTTPSSHDAVPPTVASVSADVAEPQIVREVIEVEADPVEVEELPLSVVRVLEAEGNVRRETRSELGLADSVVNVLLQYDAVLQVAEGNADEAPAP